MLDKNAAYHKHCKQIQPEISQLAASLYSANEMVIISRECNYAHEFRVKRRKQNIADQLKKEAASV